VSTLEAADVDRYQSFNQYDAENFRQTGSYLGMAYSEQLLIVQITSVEARDDQLNDAVLAGGEQQLLTCGSGTASARTNIEQFLRETTRGPETTDRLAKQQPYGVGSSIVRGLARWVLFGALDEVGRVLVLEVGQL
jgi:hypothetical protein